MKKKNKTKESWHAILYKIIIACYTLRDNRLRKNAIVVTFAAFLKEIYRLERKYTDHRSTSFYASASPEWPEA